MYNTGKKSFCYGYVRVSTVKQVTDGVSLDTQRRLIQDWASREKAVLLKIEADEGMSGRLKYKERPGLKKIISALKPGNVLITSSLTRVGRDMSDVLKLTDKIKSKGAYVIFLQEKLDSRNPECDVAIKLMSFISEVQLKNITDASKASAQAMHNKGRHNGPVPYGYRKISADKGSGLEEYPEQQDIIRLIKTKRQTESISDIVRYLNTKEIPGPRGGQWNYNTVKALCERGPVKILGRNDTRQLENVTPNKT